MLFFELIINKFIYLIQWILHINLLYITLKWLIKNNGNNWIITAEFKYYFELVVALVFYEIFYSWFSMWEVSIYFVQTVLYSVIFVIITFNSMQHHCALNNGKNHCGICFLINLLITFYNFKENWVIYLCWLFEINYFLGVYLIVTLHKLILN